MKKTLSILVFLFSSIVILAQSVEYLQPIVTQYLVCNKSEIWP